MALARRLQSRPLLTSLVYTGSGFLPVFLVSAQIIQLDAELGFGVGELAIASAAFYGMSAMAGIRAGKVVARVGPTAGFRIGASLTAAAGLMAAATPIGWLIPVATGLSGTANGIIQISANLAIFDGVRKGRQGMAYGAKQSAVPLSSVVAGLALPIVALAVGWRWTFVGAAVIALVLLVSVPQFDTARIAERDEARRGRPPAALLPLALAGFSGAFAGNAAALFVVPSATSVGIAEAAAGTVLAVCSTIVVAVRVGAGWTVDRRQSSGYPEMIALVATGSLAAVALAGAATPGPYLVAMPLVLLGAWGWPAVYFFTIVHSFSDIPGRASGLLMAGNFTGTIVGPLAVGFFASRDQYPTAWMIVATAAGVSAVLFAVSYRLYRARSAVRPEGGR